MSDRQSDALHKAGNPASPASITIDLHVCTPGAAAVNDATGTTHFAFSGVKQDEHTPTMSDCILYIGREVAGQTWDESLNAKCTWAISDGADYNARSFTVNDKGIQFGDFLGSCQDLRTGRAPADLSGSD